jgi:hypothetical protein
MMMDCLLNKNILFSSLRGTGPFWEKKKNNVLRMMEALGPPSLWCTFSSADTHWPDCLQQMTEYVIVKVNRYELL